MAIDVRSFIKSISKKISEDQVSLHASSLAFLSIISLVPILAIAYLVFSLAGGFQKIQILIESYMFQNLAPSFADQVMSYFVAVKRNVSPQALGYFGVIGFMITSYNALERVELSFNNIWGIQRHRGFLKKITVYWTLLSLGPVLVGFSLYLGTKSLAFLVPNESTILPALLAFFLTFCFFSCLLFFLPNQKVGKSSALLGGLVTAVFFEVAKQCYAIYVGTSVVKSVYGALASIPLFFVWIYIAWYIVLLGAELCFFLDSNNYNSNRKKTLNFDVDLLSDIVIFLFSDNKNLTIGKTLQEISNFLEVNITCLIRHIDFLVHQGLLVESKGSAFQDTLYLPTKSSKSKLLQDLLSKTQDLGYKAYYLLPQDMLDDEGTEN